MNSKMIPIMLFFSIHTVASLDAPSLNSTTNVLDSHLTNPQTLDDHGSTPSSTDGLDPSLTAEPSPSTNPLDDLGPTPSPTSHRIEPTEAEPSPSGLQPTDDLDPTEASPTDLLSPSTHPTDDLNTTEASPLESSTHPTANLDPTEASPTDLLSPSTHPTDDLDPTRASPSPTDGRGSPLPTTTTQTSSDEDSNVPHANLRSVPDTGPPPNRSQIVGLPMDAHTNETLRDEIPTSLMTGSMLYGTLFVAILAICTVVQRKRLQQFRPMRMQSTLELHQHSKSGSNAAEWMSVSTNDEEIIGLNETNA